MIEFATGARVRATVTALVAALALLAGACATSGNGTPSPITAVPPHSGFMMVAHLGGGFFSLPWPNDVRKIDGHPDTRGLPGIQTNIFNGDPIPAVPLLPESVTKASAAISDFGTNSAVYFQANADIDAATLPAQASETLTETSTVMLINLDDNSRAPVIPVWEQWGDRFRPNRLLTLLPYPGHPLEPDTDYAAVVFDGVQTTAGDPIDPAPLISQLDLPWDETHGVSEFRWDALRTQRDRVRNAVDVSTDWTPADIAAFTVYHTQDTDREIDAIAAAVAALPSPTISVTSQAPCAVDSTIGGNGATNSLVLGTLEVPDFQTGAYPYTQYGGTMVFDTNGDIVQQKVRTIPVRIRVPCGAAPAGGWPSIAHVGSIDAEGDSDAFPPPYRYDGYVFAEVPTHLAGATSSTLTNVGVDPADQPGLLYGNFINPAAGRANPLQQAVHHLVLLRALEGFTVDGSTVGTTGTVGTDPTANLASGHNQGAATLPLVASAAPGLEAVFSSSGAGAQYHSLAHTFQRDNLALFTVSEQPLDELNPLVQLVQMVTEASDGINIGAAGLPDGLHYLNVTGSQDGCVPLEASRHFATAMGLDVANRQFPTSVYGDPLLDPPTTGLPAGANGPGGATRVQLETPGGNEQALMNIGVGTAFLDSVAAGVAPTVPNQGFFSTYFVCGYRYDSLGGDPFGRV